MPGSYCKRLKVSLFSSAMYTIARYLIVVLVGEHCYREVVGTVQGLPGIVDNIKIAGLAVGLVSIPAARRLVVR